MYKTLLKSYSLSSLKETTASETPRLPSVTQDWDDALNKYAKEGWVVQGNGAFESSGNIVFWALLEKEEQEEAINTGF